MRELRDHAEQLRQWATLRTPSCEGAGIDAPFKKIVSALSTVVGIEAEGFWLYTLTSYHAARAEKVSDVRNRILLHILLTIHFIDFSKKSLRKRLKNAKPWTKTLKRLKALTYNCHWRSIGRPICKI